MEPCDKNPCYTSPETGVIVTSPRNKDNVGSSTEDRVRSSVETTAVMDQEEALKAIDEDLKATKDLLHVLNNIMSDLFEIQRVLSERKRRRNQREQEDAKTNASEGRSK